MDGDLALSEIDISARVSRKLGQLAIRGVRQLYSRLKHEDAALRSFLGLSQDEFSQLRHTVESVIQNEYPEDTLPRIHPRVSKAGVAVDRISELGEFAKPKKR